MSEDCKPSWYIRPNPEDRKIKKLEDRIIDIKTELIENWKTELYSKTELVILILPTFISMFFYIINLFSKNVLLNINKTSVRNK